MSALNSESSRNEQITRSQMILFLGLEHFQYSWDEGPWHKTWNFHLLLSGPFLPLPSFVSWAAPNAPHTGVMSMDIHSTHKAKNPEGNPPGASVPAIHPASSRWHLYCHFCSWYRAHPAQQLLFTPSSKPCTNRPLLDFWSYPSIQELPGKLSLPVTLLWAEIFTLFPSQ